MQYDFNLLAGQSQNIDVKGRFFKYKSGTGMIRVRTSLGGAVDLLPGQGVEDVEFTGLTVSDRSGANNVGSILAGAFKYTDDRISGSVEVIDGGRNRTIANQAFMTNTYCGPTAGNTPMVQLWNPVGSGKRVVVERVTRSSGSAGNIVVALVNYALATFDKYARSKLSGGSVSTSEVRYFSKVGAQNDPALTSDPVQANVPLLFQFIEPVVLLPGFGLVIAASSIGTDVVGAFEYFEELI